MAIQMVGVVGCGLMGTGIAQVAAASGHQVVVCEVSQHVVDDGLETDPGIPGEGGQEGQAGPGGRG